MDVFGWLRGQGYEIDTEIYDHISLWHAWYKGKVDRVHKYWVYNGRNKIPCQRLTLNMAKQVCQDWADLLLNEKVHINQDSKTTEDFIVSVLDANNFWMRGNQAIENAFWSGLVACLPYPTNVETSSDGDITNASGISLSFSVGEQIIPLLVVSGECLECAFLHNATIGDKTYCLLKMYTKPGGTYVVQNKVFDITNQMFTEVEDFRSLKPFENLVSVWDTGLTTPPFAFIKPNICNNICPDSPFSVAVFSGAEDIMQGVDTAYDAYINEFVIGKTRVMVTSEAVRFEDGSPTFDSNDVVFYQLPIGSTADPKPFVQPIQPSIRAAEMQTGINDNLNLLSMRCGFGERHYKFDTGSVATATQVVSENSHMFRTLKKHEIILDAFFKRLCSIIVEFGRMYMGQALDTTPVTVDFDDSIIEDKQQMLNDMRLDVSGGILKPEIYLSKKYNVSEEEARQMMPEPEPEYVYAGGGAE